LRALALFSRFGDSSFEVNCVLNDDTDDDEGLKEELADDEDDNK
jgi:hypothetical protein